MTREQRIERTLREVAARITAERVARIPALEEEIRELEAKLTKTRDQLRKA